MREVARLNDEAVASAAARVEEALWNLENKRVALLGLAFKPGTDDIRFSPALALARRLLDDGAQVVGFDPQAAVAARHEVPELQVAGDPYEAATDAHCLVVATEWAEFQELDLTRLRDLMAYPVIVDGRNAFDPAAAAAAGFTYYAMGRPAVHPSREARPNGDGRPLARTPDTLET
jgi:UDPglucose 6-dehydrogenase